MTRPPAASQCRDPLSEKLSHTGTRQWVGFR